ncbi:MAG: thymidine phosphorylase [Clostridiales Family XIII bacterium]|jgi:pyrimidine-nucleoside phosphorylase|nr:thymidine phosphorylase [Clostridiales Family XIII bacterium]
MFMRDVIQKKRDGGSLSAAEIDFFVNGYTEGAIPDYQAAALLMAICFSGLSADEIFLLTGAIARSGEIVDLSGVKGTKVDKHSTGGVGDKTTFVAAPLAAACGVPVAKMSGRGLGFTGGTVDKMESIPGMRSSLGADEFIALVNRTGIAVIGQTGRVAPADKKIYALRDVTATVDSLGLIASSIMGKKLASGSDAFVLDIKCGSGAFMGTLADAMSLGETMAGIGEAAGKKVIAVVTDMDQPLGRCVGNSIEVIEAIETLKGRGPDDVTELSLRLASYMICAGGAAGTRDEGYGMAERALESGAGLGKFREFVGGQHGDPRVTEDYSLFPEAAFSEPALSGEDGIVSGVDAALIGLASQRAGAGRETKDDAIDLSAGIVMRKKRGDAVRAGEPLAEVFGSDPARLRIAAETARSAFAIGRDRPARTELIRAVIDGRGPGPLWP